MRPKCPAGPPRDKVGVHCSGRASQPTPTPLTPLSVAPCTKISGINDPSGSPSVACFPPLHPPPSSWSRVRDLLQDIRCKPEQSACCCRSSPPMTLLRYFYSLGPEQRFMYAPSSTTLRRTTSELVQRSDTTGLPCARHAVTMGPTAAYCPLGPPPRCFYSFAIVEKKKEKEKKTTPHWDEPASSIL